MKIKTEAIRYHGYLQGFKVWINRIKYPKKHGHWYTTMQEDRAVIYAKMEHSTHFEMGNALSK